MSTLSMTGLTQDDYDALDMPTPSQQAIPYQHRVFLAAVHAHQIAEQAEHAGETKRHALALKHVDRLVRALIEADIEVGYAGPSLYLAYKNYVECPGHRDKILHFACGQLPDVDQHFARKRVEVKRYVRRTQWQPKGFTYPVAI